jgi:hypothetical protein
MKSEILQIFLLSNNVNFEMSKILFHFIILQNALFLSVLLSICMRFLLNLISTSHDGLTYYETENVINRLKRIHLENLLVGNFSRSLDAFFVNQKFQYHTGPH